MNTAFLGGASWIWQIFLLLWHFWSRNILHTLKESTSELGQMHCMEKRSDWFLIPFTGSHAALNPAPCHYNLTSLFKRKYFQWSTLRFRWIIMRVWCSGYNLCWSYCALNISCFVLCFIFYIIRNLTPVFSLLAVKLKKRNKSRTKKARNNISHLDVCIFFWSQIGVWWAASLLLLSGCFRAGQCGVQAMSVL